VAKRTGSAITLRDKLWFEPGAQVAA
jgi:hypothetical protein